VAEALRPASGGILLINGAHDWYRLPDHGRQVSRQLYAQLTRYRNELLDEIAVISAGRAGPLLRWLDAYPPLAARFQAVVDFPGYSAEQLAVIFCKLADEAGLRLTAGARRKAAAVLAQAEAEHRSGNARLAVRLLNEARVTQARRVTGPSTGRVLAALVTVIETDIPQHLHPGKTASDEDGPGQYL
jgi:hypothetical protein